MQASLKNVVKRELLKNPDNTKEHNSFKVVSILMMATGVFRLYVKEDFRIFFERLALLASHYKVIDRFYLDNELLTYSTEKTSDVFTVNDVADCTGIMFGAYPTDNVPFERWIDEIQIMLNNAIIGAYFSEIILFKNDLSISSESLNSKKIELKNIKEIPTITEINNSKILAESLLTELPSDLFDKWKMKFPNALVEYENELKRIKSISQFSFENLSMNVQLKVKNHFEQFFNQNDYDEAFVRKLTHLAWAYANNYIFEDDHGLDSVEEYINFDERGLELEDGGINLNETFTIYSLNDLWDDLKNIK